MKIKVIGLQWVWLVILMILSGHLFAQRPISGTVKDEKGKGIAYARVMIKSTTVGTVTDTLGKFTLKSKGNGPDTLVVSYLGYTTLNFPVAAGADASNLNLKMKEVESTINDVVITAGMIEASNESNVAVLKPLDIVTTAGSQGDIAGAIQTLPGVQRNGGDQTGLMVRGGDVSETAVIVDGTIAQNAFGPAVPGVGARSRFSPFQFKGTAFSSGGYSVRYGQAMSSVLDLQTNDMPDESTINFGLNMAGVYFSGAKKFETSAVEFAANYTNVAPFFLLAASNVDFYAPPTGAGFSGRWVSKVGGDKGIFKMNFNQTFSKVGIKIPDPASPGEEINFLIKNEYTFFNASFSYWLRPTWKVFTAVAYSDNTDDIEWGTFPSQRADNRTQARGELLWLPKARLSFLLGTDLQRYRYTQRFDTLLGGFDEFIPAGYFEAQWKPKSWLGFKAGVRAEYSQLLAKANVAPRASLAVKTGANSQISMAGGYFYQAPQPNYLLFGYRPDFQHSIHSLLNYQWMRDDRTIRVEAYWKLYNNLILENGIPYSPNQFRFYYGQVDNGGSGYARGIDVFWRDRKSIKNFDYWISYSFIDTERHYQNYPEQATPDFVSAHNLNVITKYWWNKPQISINVSYNYASGRPYYDPLSTSFLADHAPDFHNVSLSVAHLRSIKKIFAVFYGGLDNVLNQKNVLGYRYSATGLERYPILPPLYRSVFVGANFSLSKFNKDEL
jgi:hypothetical protein